MAERHVARLDTDKDGKVSRQEFLARQSEMFSKVDANSDGFVTPAEMTAQHEKRHASRAGRAGGSQQPAPAPAK
jgi:Ca2+-binding EF-hand superfamily protein